MDWPREAGYNLAMGEPVSDFHSLVTRFRGIEEDAYDFEEQSHLLAAARDLLQIRPYQEWTADEIRDFLFVCSLDPDEELVPCLGLEGLCGGELAQSRSRLLALASHSLEIGTQQCRSQFAEILRGAGALDEELETLLVRFAEDEDEYVRRMAVDSLGQLHSPLSEHFALRLWHRENPNQQHSRMMALSVLKKIGSKHFDQLAGEAATGELPILARYARAMLAPVPTIPIARLSPGEPLGLDGAALRFAARLSEKECLIFPKMLRLEENTLSLYADVWMNTFVRWPDNPGALDNPSHQVRLRDLQLDVREVAHFCGQARAWLELPLAEIGKLHFEGEFTLGSGGSHLDLTFKPRQNLPHKTDWFILTVRYRTQGGHGELVLESDRSCLEEFVTNWETLEV
ncbi:HEAT repeat domain-containing protein [bacterium]|nr:HEAT repeat domain-containing protein [bacterium]